MKKLIVLLCFFILSVYQLRAQTVTDSTIVNNIDSTTSYRHDSMPAIAPLQMLKILFQNLTGTEITTGILIDKSLPFVNFNNFTGDTTVDSIPTYHSILGLVAEMNRGAIDSTSLPFPSVVAYRDTVDQYVAQGLVPICIFSAAYNKIKPNSIANNRLILSSGQLYDVTPRDSSPYASQYAFAAASGLAVQKSYDVTFIVPSFLALDNTGGGFGSLQIDFGDGGGLVAVALNTPYTIHYVPGGMSPMIKLRIAVFPGLGTPKVTYTQIYIQPSPTGQYGSGTTLNWNISATSRHSGGKVTIGLGCGNDRLMRPLIVAKGFDPTNSIDYKEFIKEFLAFNSQNLANEVNNAGYDIVYVDYNNNLDSIERNARLLEDVIVQVNETLVANGSHEQPVVLGISMGGLISRWCLKTMENEHTANSAKPVHNVKKFISFDSPQRGAYVPLSVQYLLEQLYYLKLDKDNFRDENPQIAEFYNVLTSPAASEMLVLQVHDYKTMNMHKSENIVYAKSSFMSQATPFLAGLETLGYPADCRNVAIANGSQVGKDQGYGGANVQMASIVPGGLMMLFLELLQTGPYITITANSLPTRAMGSQVIYDGHVGFMFAGLGYDISTLHVSVQNTDALENAPGGQYDINDFVASNNGPTITQLIKNEVANSGCIATINHTSFCFIPTVSALDVQANTSNDPFVNVGSAGIIANNLTKFKNYVANTATSGVVNELHTDFSITNQPLFEYELGLINRTLDSIGYGVVLANISYNFGYNATYGDQTLDRIGSTDVYNGTILVNYNTRIGLYAAGNNNPTTGSNFDVYTEGADCYGGPVTVTIDTTGGIWLGDSSVGNTGTFWIGASSSLWLYGGAKISPNCHIIVQNGGAMYLMGGTINISANAGITVLRGGILIDSTGALIRLYDSSSVIDIEGKLHIASGQTFFINSGNQGYVRFVQTSVDAGTRNITGTGAFVLNGNSSYHKILQIDGGEAVYPADNQAIFSVTNGKITLGHSSRLNIGCPLRLNNVYVTSTNGSFNDHRGVNIYGQSALNIDSVHIDNGDYGIYAPLFYGGYGATFHKVWVELCNTGVYTEGASQSVEFDSCRFTDNDDDNWLGIYCPSGYLTNCYLNSGTTGVNVVNDPASAATVTVYQSKITNMEEGLNGANTGFIVNTSEIVGNTNGIYSTNGDIIMDPLKGGGYGNISGNDYGLYLFGTPGDIYLENGNNDLISISLDLETHLSYCETGTVSADDNAWNTMGNPPTSGIDYDANDFCLLPSFYSITDASPQSTYTGFYTGPTSSTGQSYLRDKEFASFKLNNETLEQNIHNGMMACQNLDYAEEGRIFYNVVMQYLSMDHPDNRLLQHMYSHMISGACEAVTIKQVKPESELIDSIINIQDLIFNSLNNADEKDIRYMVMFDKSGLKRLQGKRKEALAIMESLVNWATPENIDILKSLQCTLNAEDLVLSGVVPKEKFGELVKGCVKPTPQPNNRTKGQILSQKALDESQSMPVLFPNPADNTFSVIINANSTTDLITNITSAEGKVLIANVINPLANGENIFNFSTADFQPGIYIISLTYNGKDYKEKLVITRP